MTAETGDRADLPFEPQPRAWAMVSVGADRMPGRGPLPRRATCASPRRPASGPTMADVVVVNTHLYATHLAVGGAVLPDHDVVIFDEAHELEDVASSSLGLELAPGRFFALARNARPLVDRRRHPRRPSTTPAPGWRRCSSPTGASGCPAPARRGERSSTLLRERVAG